MLYAYPENTAIPAVRSYVAICHIMDLMAKSIRISDELYELAQLHAALGTRSLAQQFEHWAKLGLAADGGRSGLGAAAVEYQHAALEAAVRAGRVSAQALRVIPAAFARNATLRLPDEESAIRSEAW